MRRRRLSVELEDEGRARFCRFVPPNREASRGVCHPAAQGPSSAHETRRRSYRPAPIRSSLRSHLPTFPGLTLVNSPRRAPRPISAHAERVQKGFGVTFSDSKNDETCQFHLSSQLWVSGRSPISPSGTGVAHTSAERDK